MPVPANIPIGLTDEFANDETRQALWQAFLKKNDIAILPLTDIVRVIQTKLQPAMILAASVATRPGKQNAS